MSSSGIHIFLQFSPGANLHFKCTRNKTRHTLLGELESLLVRKFIWQGAFRQGRCQPNAWRLFIAICINAHTHTLLASVLTYSRCPQSTPTDWHHYTPLSSQVGYDRRTTIAKTLFYFQMQHAPHSSINGIPFRHQASRIFFKCSYADTGTKSKHYYLFTSTNMNLNAVDLNLFLNH